jgi:HEAT repeat protein
MAKAKTTLTTIMLSGLMEPVRFGGLIAKRWPVVCGALLVAAVGGLLLWSPWVPREPIYDGHPISHWLTNWKIVSSLEYTDLPDHHSIRQAVGDSNAVPFLIKALRRDAWLGAAYYRKWLWPKLPSALQAHLPPPAADNPAIRLNALYVLSQMESLAQPAIPALIQTSKQDEQLPVRYRAMWALADIGKGDRNATAALTQAIKDNDWNISVVATKALSKIDPEAPVREGASVAALVRRLRSLNPNGPGAMPAAEFLTGLNKGDSNVTAAVTEALRDVNRWIREAATNALPRIDPGAALEAGIPAARVVSQAYTSLPARTAVAGALARGDTRVVGAFAAVLNDSDQNLRYTAGLVLAATHPQTAAKVAVTMLKNSDSSIRLSAVTILGQVGKRDTNAISGLVEALQDREYNVRSAATNWLINFAPEAAAKAGIKMPSP